MADIAALAPSPFDGRVRYITVEDIGEGGGPVDIAVATIGEGPPLVVVHGLGGSMHVWDDVAEAFAERFTVHALDLRGHGRSGGPGDAAGYRLWRLADDILQVVDRLDLDRPQVLAHSLGGTASMWACVRRAGAFGSLTLVNTWAFGLPPDQMGPLHEQMQFVRRHGPGRMFDLRQSRGTHDSLMRPRMDDDPGFRERRREEAYRTRRVAMLGLLGEIAGSRSFDAWLWQARVPVALLCGELDQMMLWGMGVLAERFGVPVRLLEGAGHNPMMERPVPFADATLEALRSVAPSAGVETALEASADTTEPPHVG